MTLTLPGIKFNHPSILVTALTHRSSLNEKKGQASYERLEFLGDAVLELIVSTYLFKKYPHQPEGKLTHLRSMIVQTKSLAHAAERLELGSHLILSRGEKAGGGQKNPSLLADCFEAIIGAIYLDLGLAFAKKFIHQHLLKYLDDILHDQSLTDYKSRLQEVWQKHSRQVPVYKLIKTSGPDHHKIFKIHVYLDEKLAGQGQGQSKQTAQQQAAKSALEGLSHF